MNPLFLLTLSKQEALKEAEGSTEYISTVKRSKYLHNDQSLREGKYEVRNFQIRSCRN